MEAAGNGLLAIQTVLHFLNYPFFLEGKQTSLLGKIQRRRFTHPRDEKDIAIQLLIMPVEATGELIIG